MTAQWKLDALKVVAPSATLCEASTGFPARVQLAQYALESSYGRKMPPNSRNPFGIKSAPGTGVLVRTQEWLTPAQLDAFLRAGQGRAAILVTPEQTDQGRKLYLVTDWFAVFPTIRAAFEAHAKLFTRPRYKPAFDAYLASPRAEADVRRFIRAMAPVYATSPSYGLQVESLAFGEAVSAALA